MFPTSRKMDVRLTDHQAIIQETILAEPKLTYFISQHYTSHNGSARRTETPTQGDRVYDVHMSLSRECPLAMASKYVKCYTGDQVNLGVQTDLLGTVAQVVICDTAVKWFLR